MLPRTLALVALPLLVGGQAPACPAVGTAPAGSCCDLGIKLEVACLTENNAMSATPTFRTTASCPAECTAAWDALIAACPVCSGAATEVAATCTGEASEVAATCTGDATDGTSTCDLDAGTDGSAECPAGCTSTPTSTPTCDLVAGTDGTAECPAGCTSSDAYTPACDIDAATAPLGTAACPAGCTTTADWSLDGGAAGTAGVAEGWVDMDGEATDANDLNVGDAQSVAARIAVKWLALGLSKELCDWAKPATNNNLDECGHAQRIAQSVAPPPARGPPPPRRQRSAADGTRLLADTPPGALPAMARQTRGRIRPAPRPRTTARPAPPPAPPSARPSRTPPSALTRTSALRVSSCLRAWAGLAARRAAQPQRRAGAAVPRSPTATTVRSPGARIRPPIP